MLIPASVEDVQAHIQSAVDLTHPLHKHGSRLPPDVRDAVLWVVQRGTSVAAERTTRLQQLASIQSSLDGWDSYLWKEGVPEHVKAMIAYKPRLAFLHALVIALKWPFQDLVLNMAAGFAPVGMQPDTGIWCLDPPENHSLNVSRGLRKMIQVGMIACSHLWLELRRLPPIMGFVGSGPGLVIILT